MKRDARQPMSIGQKTRTRPTIWDAVYAIVRRVPRGHVVTYGQIAKLLENRISPRYVGFALHVCPKDVPWHRVVNATGGCSTDRLPEDQPGRQRILLEMEGVSFRPNGTLSIEDHRWRAGEKRKVMLNVTKSPILAVAVALAVLSGPACQQRWHGLVLSHGAEIDVKNYASTGKYTIIDFFSDDCPACMQLSPELERLDRERRDVVLVKVDVDRPGSRGIDWGSPVAQQYDLHALPHLRIYGKDGLLKSEGDAAIETVLSWIGGNQSPP